MDVVLIATLKAARFVSQNRIKLKLHSRLGLQKNRNWICFTRRKILKEILLQIAASVFNGAGANECVQRTRFYIKFMTNFLFIQQCFSATSFINIPIQVIHLNRVLVLYLLAQIKFQMAECYFPRKSEKFNVFSRIIGNRIRNIGAREYQNSIATFCSS